MKETPPHNYRYIITEEDGLTCRMMRFSHEEFDGYSFRLGRAVPRAPDMELDTIGYGMWISKGMWHDYPEALPFTIVKVIEAGPAPPVNEQEPRIYYAPKDEVTS